MNSKKQQMSGWDDFKKADPIPTGFTGCYKNSRYTVFTVVIENEFFGSILYLSIKHNDKSPVHDWRDLYTIKNMLAGTHCEAFEIYPHRDRLVDNANQFHLWCLAPNQKLPIGYTTRDVVRSQKETDIIMKAKYNAPNGQCRQRDMEFYHRDDIYMPIGIAWRDNL